MVPSSKMHAGLGQNAATRTLEAEPRAAAAYDHVPFKSASCVYTLDTSTNIFLMHSIQVRSFTRALTRACCCLALLAEVPQNLRELGHAFRNEGKGRPKVRNSAAVCINQYIASGGAGTRVVARFSTCYLRLHLLRVFLLQVRQLRPSLSTAVEPCSILPLIAGV